MTSLRDLVANHFNSDDDDASLHLIFTHVFRTVMSGQKASPDVSFHSVVCNLYRLYTWDEWEAARTYLHLLTGNLIDEDHDEHAHFIMLNGEEIVLSKDSILETCEKLGGILKDIGVDEEEEEDDSEDTDYDGTDDDGTDDDASFDRYFVHNEPHKRLTGDVSDDDLSDDVEYLRTISGVGSASLPTVAASTHLDEGVGGALCASYDDGDHGHIRSDSAMNCYEDDHGHLRDHSPDL